MAPRNLLMVDMLAAVYWMDEALQAGLRARGWSNVTRTQSMILSNMARGVGRASQLARNLGVSRQAMSQALAEMVERGLVEVGPDPADGRAQIVTFSAQSAAIRADAIAIFEIIDAVLVERIGRKRLDALHEALAADWGAAPVEIVQAGSGQPPPAAKRRGRPQKTRAEA